MFKHSFTPGFNAWYIVVPVAIAAIYVIAYVLSCRIAHIERRGGVDTKVRVRSKSWCRFIGLLASCGCTYLIVSESFRGICQMFANWTNGETTGIFGAVMTVACAFIALTKLYGAVAVSGREQRILVLKDHYRDYGIVARYSYNLEWNVLWNNFRNAVEKAIQERREAKEAAQREAARREAEKRRRAREAEEARRQAGQFRGEPEVIIITPTNYGAPKRLTSTAKDGTYN